MSIDRFLTVAIAFAFAFAASPVSADGRPEFERVGKDTSVPKAFSSGITKQIAKENGWNRKSDFAAESFVPPVPVSDDPCFKGYESALTVPGTPRIYTWFIVLQMDVESDLAIGIIDCVLKPGGTSPFGGIGAKKSSGGPGAGQTSRSVMPDGSPVFNPGANPQVTATASPGPFAVTGFVTPFDLVNRTQGGLFLLPLRDLLYTSIGIFGEGLMARMPEFMVPNLSGQTEYPLSAGDIIRVDVSIPASNTVDIRYGEKSVYIKYIGTAGTQVFAP